MEAKFALETTVPVSRTKAELEKLVRDKYGATAYGMWEDQEAAHVVFSLDDRNIRFSLPIPKRGHLSETKHNQALRSVWRALMLLIKGTLEGVARGVVKFETAFLPYFVTSNGDTVAERVEREGVLPLANGPLMLTAGHDDVIDAEEV